MKPEYAIRGSSGWTLNISSSATTADTAEQSAAVTAAADWRFINISISFCFLRLFLPEFRAFGGSVVPAECTGIHAVTGGETTIALGNGKRLKVKIPAGVSTDSTLRLKGQGATGAGGRAGDALIKIKVQESPTFKREGDNVSVTVPITLKEAVLGGKIPVPTPSGVVMMTIPAYSGSNKTLRLKGKGVKGKGDLLVSLQVVLPEKPDTALTEFMKGWNEPYQNLKRG